MVALDVDQDQNHTQGRYDGAWLIFNVIHHFVLHFVIPFSDFFTSAFCLPDALKRCKIS